MRVGKEEIYQKDLDIEMKYSPPQSDKKSILEKMAEDSIVLQAASAEKIINLDASVFSNPTKDYFKRLSLVKTAKDILNQRADMIKGTVITIWFYNNEYVGPKGYTENKKIALKKIQTIHEKVTTKTLTLEEAINEIKNDASLFELDRAYKTNASFDFSVYIDQPISFDPSFNTVLTQLPENSYSSVYPLKDPTVDIDESKEVLYAFGYVKEKKIGGNKNFDLWLKAIKSKYPIIYK